MGLVVKFLQTPNSPILLIYVVDATRISMPYNRVLKVVGFLSLRHVLFVHGISWLLIGSSSRFGQSRKERKGKKI